MGFVYLLSFSDRELNTAKLAGVYNIKVAKPIVSSLNKRKVSIYLTHYISMPH